MTKTDEAMALVDQGMPAYAAAKEKEISPNTLYVALARRRKKQAGLCPSCGRPMKVEPTIDAYPTNHPATRLESSEPSFRDKAITWLDAQAESQPDPVGKKWIAAIAKGMRTLGG